MKNIKPINVIFEPGLAGVHQQTVLRALQQLLQLAQVNGRISIQNFGVWRPPGWRNGTALVPYGSSDWYILQARGTSTRPAQLNADTIITCLQNEPWQRYQAHYDVVVLHSDMYSAGTNFVIGLALAGLGTVVSVNRFLQVKGSMQQACIETEVFHEMGHVFGLIPNNRTENVKISLGRHCSNICTMRQGLRLPDDWIQFTQDRLRSGNIFCAQCRNDLLRWFA